MPINEEFNFSYELPEGFEEMPRSDYEKYHIDPSTVFCIINSDTHASISLTRDVDIFSQEDYEEVISLKNKNMKKFGMDVSFYGVTSIKSPSEYKVYLSQSTYLSLHYNVYFLAMRNVAFAITNEIKNEDDIHIIERLIESIKLL